MSLDPRRWWSTRWQEVLERSGASHARRVQRGQALARRGAVDDLQVAPGLLRARVREDRVAPYDVELRLDVPHDAAWDAALDALSAQVRYTAALLEGQLPEGVDDLLREAGVSLVPEDLQAFELHCTCDEPVRPCRHLAALHTAAGAAFDRDPFLLLQLRGRDRDQLLRELRARRGGDTELIDPGLDLSRGLFAATGDLDAVALQPSPVEDPSALFQRLGPPPGVDDDRPFIRVIERAAEAAWRLAAGAGAAAADEELLLAELRAQRIATAGSLASALGREEDDVRAELDRLFEAGTVLRTGAGERARYRAAS